MTYLQRDQSRQAMEEMTDTALTLSCVSVTATIFWPTRSPEWALTPPADLFIMTPRSVKDYRFAA